MNNRLTGVPSCDRYDDLIHREHLSEEEMAYVVAHQEDCPLGIHTVAAAEEGWGLAPGALKAWDGLFSLPPRDPKVVAHQLAQIDRALAELEGDSTP